MKFYKDIFLLSTKIGIPAVVQQALFSLGLMALQSIVNKFGTDTIAAYIAGGRIDSFAVMPIMNFSGAISTFTGQNIGVRYLDRVKKGYRATLIMAGTTSLVITGAVMVFGESFIRLFNTNQNVIEIRARYLEIMSGFYIVMAAMFVINGVLKGAGDTLIPMGISIVFLWLIRVPFAWFFQDT
ncbi:MAG: hypothetical protein JJT76_09960 [Clostridiaceae bacterium]|nr:hypothetical protein [Clostridiaceae bacterium]